jgi:hypothetical protein
MQASEELESLLCCRWQNVTGVLQHADMTASDGSLPQHAKSAATSWLVLRWPTVLHMDLVALVVLGDGSLNM